MKILFFTDPHITTNRPIGRKDDYIATISSKLEEMVALSLEMDYMIIGGDIFHRAKANIQELSIFANFVNKIDESCCLYVCPGNHDLLGYNYQKLDQTGIGLCDKFLSNMNLMSADKVHVKLQNKRPKDRQLNNNIWLHFRPSTNKVQDNFMVQREEGINLGLMHEMLVEKPFFDDYILIDDFNTNLDAVFNGHYHSGHSPLWVNQTFYINPGSMMRMTRGKTDTKRIPKYAIIYIYEEQKERDFVVSYFPFQSYSSDVFIDDIEEEIRPFFNNIEVKDPIGISAMDYINIRARDFDLTPAAQEVLAEIKGQLLTG